MIEKEKLLTNLVDKSGKSKDELSKLIKEKVNELSGLISEEGAIYIIANELGVRLDSEKPKKEANLLKIDEITEPKVPVSLACKVIRKYDRVTFSSKNGGEGSVQSILAGDETGVIRVVFWNDKTDLLESVHEGDVLKIINAYTRENNNSERIEVHYSQYSDIEVNPNGVNIELKEFQREEMSFVDKKISEIEEGDRNIKVSGIVTDFEIPRFYLGCPECFKKVFQDDGVYRCAEHEEVEGIKIPIVNLIIDDGNGTISIVGFRDRAENLTKLKDKEIIDLIEDIDKYRTFSKRIIGSKVDLAGNVSVNNMTGDLQLICNSVLGIELKSVEEVAGELAGEGNKVVKKTEKKVETSNSMKKEEEKEVDIDDDLEDIEEIDIDDDIL